MTSVEAAARRRVVTHSRSRGFGALFAYVVLVVGALVTLGPFVLSVSTAFKTPQQFATESPLAAPAPPTTENFASLFTSPLIDFPRSVWVTVLYVVVVLLGQLLFSVLAAYAFARLEFPGRDALFWVYVATLMVPPVVTVIPLYLMMTTFGLRNTFWALVLPYMLGSPYAIFLLREFFRGIPQDIVDAARIDGAGTWRVLTRIVVPLSRPIIATLTVITVVTHWNNFLWPLIITTGDTWQVMTVATASMQGQYSGNWTLVMAATTLSMLPLIAVFLIFNRRIVDSIAITGFR